MFEEQTFDGVLKRMKSSVQADIDTREGSVMHNALAPAALELSICYDLLKLILRETYADTASREYLVLRAAEKGISPNPPTYAEVKARITGDVDPNDLIGATFACDAIFYTVLEPIEGEENAYRLECQTAGTAGNIPTGYLTNENYIDGVETAEIISILNYAEDEEETEAFRSRYMAAITSTPFAGNVSAYKEIVESFDSVGGCKVLPAWSFDDKNGKVKIIVLSGSNESPTPEEIEELQQAICPGIFIYTIPAASEVASIAVGQDVWTRVSGESGEFEYGEDRTAGGLANTILSSFHDGVVSTTETGDTIISSPVNYDVVGIEKSYDLTGGTGTGLAPIGHDVQIVPAVPKLVIVNFSENGNLGKNENLISRNDLIAAMKDVYNSFANAWDQTNGELAIKFSWFVTALQMVTNVESVDNLQMSMLGGEVSTSGISLPLEQYASYVPTRNDVKTMLEDAVIYDDLTYGSYTIKSYSKLLDATFKCKITVDEHYNIKVYPFFEGNSTLAAEGTYGYMGGSYNYTQTYCEFARAINAHKYDADNIASRIEYDVATICNGESYFNAGNWLGHSILSVGQSGSCENVAEGIADKFHLVGYGDSDSQLEFTVRAFEDSYGATIPLKIVDFSDMYGHTARRTYDKLVKYAAMDYEKFLYESWLKSTDPNEKIVFDLSTFVTYCKRHSTTSEGKLVSSYLRDYMRICFDADLIEDSNEYTLNIESGRLMIPVNAIPTIGIKFVLDTHESVDTSSDEYRYGLTVK